MDLVLLPARLILASVFLVAGVAKIADRRGSVQAMRDFGVPDRFAAPLGIALPVAEIVVGLALLPLATALWGAAGALLLMLAFVVAIGVNLARGNTPDCHCFGQLHSEPAGRPALARNGMLAGVALFVLVAGWEDPGASTVAWMGDLSAIEGTMLAGGLLMLVLLAVLGWVLFHLLQQNGRLLLRLEALEHAVETGQPLKRPASGESESASGLPLGTPAPAFSLPDLAGQTTTLADVQVADSPTLLIFSDPNCGPCNELLPEIGRWQQDHAGELSVAVISSGSLEANQSKATEHRIHNVMLQQDREVAADYQAAATPSAVLIRPDGIIGSPLVAGTDAIRRMVSLATGVAGVGVTNGSAPRYARPDLLGQPSPDVVLSTLDGEEVALSSYLGQPTVLLFWNPGCGYCQRMLDDLKAVLAKPPAGAPGLVVVSTGDADLNRAQGISAPVLLDQGFTAGRQFGATGTPGAVLIDANGVVASPVVSGSSAALELMGATR